MAETERLVEASIMSTKSPLQSRTIWFSIALVTLGAIQSALPGVQHTIPVWAYGWITMGIGVATAILRTITTTSIKPE
jgi:hypothetical protein